WNAVAPLFGPEDREGAERIVQDQDLAKWLAQDRYWAGRIAQTRGAAGAVSRQLESRIKLVQVGIFVLLFLSLLFFHLYAHLFETVADPAGPPHTEHRAAWLRLSLLAVAAALALHG